MFSITLQNKVGEFNYLGKYIFSYTKGYAIIYKSYSAPTRELEKLAILSSRDSSIKGTK